MADSSTPSAADPGANKPAVEQPKKVKPEKPDEGKYRESLAKAEKTHAADQEKQVREPIELVYRTQIV